MSEICVWIPKQHDTVLKPQNLVSIFTVCGFETTCWALCGVKTTWVCGFDILLFLFDWTARINPTEVLTCRGSFGGFETTCFQLGRAASFETTGIPYFSCDRSPYDTLWQSIHCLGLGMQAGRAAIVDMVEVAHQK